MRNLQEISEYFHTTIRSLTVPNLELLRGLFLGRQHAKQEEVQRLLLEQQQCIEEAQQAAWRIHCRHQASDASTPMSDYQTVIHNLSERSPL